MRAVKTYDQDYVDECRSRMEAQLAAYFVHRTRAFEGKDGNALNEVPMPCTSIPTNQGVLCAHKTIKYKPETSVLKLEIGDEIRLDEAQFRALFNAFFAEIEHKFT